MGSASPAWLAPTSRAIPWLTVAAVAGTVMAVIAVAGLVTTTAPAVVVVLAQGAVAAGAALGLDDPAHRLLRAVPTSPRRRLGHRLVLIVPAVVLAWSAGVALGRVVFASWPPDSGLASVLALTAVAVCVATWTARRWPEQAAVTGAAAVLAWAAAEHLLPDQTVPNAVLSAWQEHPWWVLGVAGVLAAAGPD